MTDQNTTWYKAIVENPERAAKWDKAHKLDTSIVHEIKGLKQLLNNKALSLEDLMRTGARFTKFPDGKGGPALVWLFPDGLKYRSLTDGRRLSETGVEWREFKVIPAMNGDSVSAIAAEGETDGALLSRLYPDYDILICPAGALSVHEDMINQVTNYAGSVYVAYDNDDAGDNGAAKIITQTRALRMVPPDDYKDWCDAAANNVEFGPPETYLRLPPKVVYTLGELLDTDLGTYEENNYFEGGVLPVRGSCMIHGKKKSLKSMLMLEMARSLACGRPFGEYVPYIYPAGPERVLLVQVEVPPMPFQARVISFMEGLTKEEKELFKNNCSVLHMADGERPRIKVTSDGFVNEIKLHAETCEAKVVMFDPVQRMTGAANINQAHELEALLDAFNSLQQEGFTVVYAHHNNKASGKNTMDGDSASGSQRFSGDPDSICSVWQTSDMLNGTHAAEPKQRGFSWELRNGQMGPRGIEVQAHPQDARQFTVKFFDLVSGGGTNVSNSSSAVNTPNDNEIPEI